MGLVGVAAGASTAGILGIVRLMADTWFPWLASNSDHKHQMIASLHAQRHETLQQWRAGLAAARDAYRQWASGPRDHDAPNVVGDEWFEGSTTASAFGRCGGRLPHRSRNPLR